MNIAAISFSSGVKCLTVGVSLNSLAAVSFKWRLLSVKRFGSLLVAGCYQRVTSVKILIVSLRVKGYRRLRWVRGLSGGVGAAALLFPYVCRLLLVDRCRTVKVSPLSFTCNLADTYRLVPCFMGCPSGTLSDGVEIDPIPRALIDTPTPENFGSSLIYTPHRPRTNFHNSKGVTALVTLNGAT